MVEFDFLPPSDTALVLEPEEMAQHLIKCLSRLDKGGSIQTLNLHNFIIRLKDSDYRDEELLKK